MAPESIQLVEQHIIRANDPRFEVIDGVAFASKNLYNQANYLVRQAFIFEGKYLNYAAIFHLVKQMDEYCALPRKVSNLVLKQLDQNWRAFFAMIKDWREHPDKFLGQPKMPGYKHKNGRNLLVYDRQALSKPALQNGLIKPSQLDIIVKTKQQNIDQVRIVPRKNHYVVEVVYTRVPKPVEGLHPAWLAGVDIGLNNLAAITSNKPGFTPLLVNGRPLKSMNQYYHKRRAELQKHLPAGFHVSRNMIDLTNKRNRKVKYYLHVASRRIIDHLVEAGIGTLVIGRNKGWKYRVELGRQNNQAFVSIPFADFIQMLRYKAYLVGIQVIEQEESYTSKCSFLDLEPIQAQKVYAGERIARGLFRAGNGRLINADVNGSYNIIRKVSPNAFDDGVQGVAVHPSSLCL